MITELKDYTIEELLGSKARIKILKMLAIHDELSITSIIKKARCHLLAFFILQFLILNFEF